MDERAARLQLRIVVPTEELATELESHASVLQGEYVPPGMLSGNTTLDGLTNHQGTRQDAQGWRTLICMRAERFLEWVAPKNIPRRLYGILYREFPTVSANYADGFLLACGVRIEDTDIPTLPWNMTAAAEMVDAYLYATGQRMSQPERRKLERKLYNFSRGYVYGDGIPAALAIGNFLVAAHARVEERELIAA